MAIPLTGKTEEMYLESIFSRFDMKGTLAVTNKLENNPTLTATMQLNLLPSLDEKRTITLLTTVLNEDISTPFNIKLCEVNGRNITNTLEVMLCCYVLAQKMLEIEQCAYPADLDFTPLLLQAGFLEVVDYPEKFFNLFDTTPRELGLTDDIGSVNKVLAKSLSCDCWEPAITVSTEEIREYIRKATT